MKKKYFVLLPLVLLLAALLPTQALADGIIIPEPPPCDPCPIPSPMSQLVIRYHHVTVNIKDQVAVTHVDQVFYNPNDWSVEGTYVFPLPSDAGVSGFTLWVDGEPIQGKILEAEQARRQYQEIVRQLRDPALLEYAGQGAFQAHIFPIPPQGERRIELEYSQVLPAQNDLVRYVYPLNTEKFSIWPLENVSVNLQIYAEAPIRAVYSPSHPVDVHRESDNLVRVGYEERDVLPDTDFALYYSLGKKDALHLISYRDPGGQAEDGFFLLLLAPRVEASELVAKDVILVLDQSGSMEGEKFRQAQEALRYVLEHLNPEDRFNILTFSTALQTYADRMRPAEDVDKALDWVDHLSAQGSTDINRALLEAAAIADRERPTYLIFLTDGLPTQGVTSSEQILKNLLQAAPRNIRLFPFGVGYDVDTYLLDWLAQAHHGTTTYVLPGERLDEAISTFYARISAPMMTDLKLDFGDVSTYDLYPSPLPDLFQGSQIVLLGRYKNGGETTISLTGNVNGETHTLRYPDQLFKVTSYNAKYDLASTPSTFHNSLSSIPRIWATRKIGHLLQMIRLHGPDQETIEQIVQLSIRYGIVTPYTSYLVTEQMPLGENELERITSQQLKQMQSTVDAPTFGQEAVESAAAQSSLAEAETPLIPQGEVMEQVRFVGARTFLLADGVWIDTTFDPDKMSATRVAFLSDEYFALTETDSQLAAAIALGPRVIALSDGIAYEVVPELESPPPITIELDTTTPTPAVHLPIISKAGTTEAVEPPTDDTSATAPLPCLGGMLLVAAIPLALLMRARNGIRDRIP